MNSWTPAARRRRGGVSASTFCLLIGLLIATISAPASAAPAPAAGGPMARDLLAVDPGKHIQRLAAIPSRVTGYPGCYEAEQYVLDQYRSMGLANIKREPFQVIVPLDKGAALRVGGASIPLDCVRPNGVRTPQTAESGVSGKLVWGGEGRLSDFNGRDIEGCIVVMEFDTATRWLEAAKLGAAAIIFVEPRYAFRSDAEQKYVTVPAPVPRYYLERKHLPRLLAALGVTEEREPGDAGALKALATLGAAEGPELEGSVVADMIWEEKTVYMVSGEIPGTDPELGEQTLVVHAYYDSTSVVPATAPGAESACGIAAQLETGSFLLKHPPRRTVKLLATPGHFQALAGVRHYAFKYIYPRRAEVEKDAAKQLGGEPFFFIGLDLSSRHNTMAGFYKGNFYDQLGSANEIKLQRLFSDYSSILLGWADHVTGPEGLAKELEFQSGIVPQYGRDWRALLPDQVAFDAEVIGMSQRPGITLATTGDARNAVNTPLDTFEKLEPYLGNVKSQTIVSAYLIKKTADVPVIPLTSSMSASEVATEKLATIFGRSVEQALSELVPPVNVPDAVVSAELTKSKSMMGVQGRANVRSDVQGLFELFGFKVASVVVDGFVLSPSSGAVMRVGKRGLVTASRRPRLEWEMRRTDIRINFFSCVSTTVYDLLDPLQLRPLSSASVLRGASNSAVEAKFLASFLGGPVPNTSYGEPVGIFYTEKDRWLKFLLHGGAAGNDGALLNVGVKLDQKDAALEQARAETAFHGTGYLADKPENFIFRTAFRMARDVHLLDFFRLRSLEKTGIRKKNIWDLHGQAHTRLLAAELKLARKDYSGFYRDTSVAWALENRVYPDVRGTSHDVVKGVIFYFALLLPFVIFAERLLINYVDIRKKLMAIAGIFVVSYLVLMLVHPAFRLSQAPIIILDGFFMMVASLWTIWYLIQRFQTVMEHLKRHIDTIHRADVARASAAMAAFVLGISNMRKRKIRTLLTALTLILLTFTILSFTSFETMPAHILKRTTSVPAAYRGLLIRYLSWANMPEFMGYQLDSFFRSQGLNVAPRSWFVNRDKTKELKIEVRREGGEMAVVNAMLGLSPEQTAFWNLTDEDTGEKLDLVEKDAGKWFDRTEPDWPFICILPRSIHEGLNMEPDDIGRASVSVMGRRLRVVGLVASATLSKWQDLDREMLTPVDFQEQQYRAGGPGGGAGEGGLALSATGEMEAEDFISQRDGEDEEVPYVHLDPDRVLLVPHELCMKLGGTLRAISVGKPAEGATLGGRSLEQIIREFAGRITMPLFEGAETGFVNKLATRSRLSVGGLKGLMIPILIAALIVFNTMLGAVYERITEIKVYAAVGLAPIHIASLFFAESCVFAVVGAMVGYLLGQVISFALMQMPWLLEGVSLNYSSVSAVWSAMLVMVIVLGSTAYPAFMAGKLSVPDETRKMTIARPTSDVWEIRFPFTVSSREALGVMSYLRQYFASNDEDSVGAFTADNIAFYVEMQAARDETGLIEGSGETECCVLGADVWVAPLDMGISQNVKIVAVPDAEEPEITYLFFTIVRKSGEFQTWGRMNTGFLKDLRKQLLIWRLVTNEAKARLAEEGRELLSAGAGLRASAEPQESYPGSQAP